MLMHKHYYFPGLFSLMVIFSPGAVSNTADDIQADNSETEITSAEENIQPDNSKLDPAFVAEKKRDIANYERIAQELESTGGVYEVQLSEILLDLGETYQSLELHTEALKTLNRSLQITRVNNGLYSLDQLSILEKMIESNKAIKDWEEVDKSYAHLYWISKRNYGDFDTRLLPVIERLGKWHLHAYNKDVDGRPFLHLVEAEGLYTKALSIVESQHGADDPGLLKALYGIALTNYRIAAFASSAEGLEEINYGLRASSSSSRSQRVLQQEFARQDLIFRSYAKGKNAMKRVVDIHAKTEGLPIESHALALAHLGDWYLLFNKRNSAAEAYDQAYKLMSATEESKKDIDAFFAQPRMLPTISLPIEDEEPLEVTENSSYAIAMFNVTPSGRARNIEIVEINPVDDLSLKRKARKGIASSKFRPRFENGTPVETTGVKIRYVFDE